MLAEVATTLRRLGVNVRERGEVEGASGIKHVFDLLVESGLIAVDLCNGNLTTLEKAVSYVVKCKDAELAGVKTYLVMVGHRPDEVKKLLKASGLKVVDVPTVESAAECISKLLAQ